MPRALQSRLYRLGHEDGDHKGSADGDDDNDDVSQEVQEQGISMYGRVALGTVVNLNLVGHKLENCAHVEFFQ